MESVFYEELTPRKFRERIAEAPIAYLPLGTLEWHGEHLPIGSDGLQPRGFFEMLAREAGGIVFPMLFLGPDNVEVVDGKEYYGMDRGNFLKDPKVQYPRQQFDGSAYYVNDLLFDEIIDATMKQIKRAGFKIVVAHGHGPSNWALQRMTDSLEKKYVLKIINCQGLINEEEKGFMVDHAAMNETSIMMALYPNLVQMDNLPSDSTEWPAGVGGKDPRKFASVELGKEILNKHLDKMTHILREELQRLN